jgi:hypothetical protein
MSQGQSQSTNFEVGETVLRKVIGHISYSSHTLYMYRLGITATTKKVVAKTNQWT